MMSTLAEAISCTGTLNLVADLKAEMLWQTLGMLCPMEWGFTILNLLLFLCFK